MEKILDIVDVVAYEKGLSPTLVTEAIKACMIKMAKEELGEDANFRVVEDKNERDLRLVQQMSVCKDSDFSEDLKATHIPLSLAKDVAEDIKEHDTLEYDINVDIMGRGAINKIYRDIEFQLQSLIENQILEKFKTNINKIISGRVLYVDAKQNTYVEIDEMRAVLPLKNRIKGEHFKKGDMVKAILKYVNINKNGISLELSRTTPKFLEELLALEVPEIKDGDVVIYKSARLPGDKAKVALYSNNPRIDPIGSTVGSKGVRINAVSRELNGEVIDCIEYSSVSDIFIAKALSPAQIVSIKTEKPKEVVTEVIEEGMEGKTEIEASEVVSERPQAFVSILKSQKSKAIGKNGVNIRLASMITGYDIVLNELETIEEQKAEKKLGLEVLESLFKKDS
ncbi:NusA N-terminal domain-containing protein [Helicobacter sp. 11S02629-2]|uniref:NusA N-terminal domain-containing protein n=1 Tax=Helicobacter sp. 11S02629-2 TaxID=1476195 RepID=UPI000BA63CE5|nr:NusA N-terminal domain-containing protein [Helicobacter sp. 11S02629-2]PAF46083.1 transcription termination/antitermination protein NusA [Helicobacter sp. 11S02629-2]